MSQNIGVTSDNSDFWERVRKCQLPRPPNVVLQLLEVTREEADLRKPAEIISREPSLAAEILTIVNSPWFDVKREIRTIHHAVGMLGVGAICSLASAFVLRDGLSQFSTKGFDYACYWRRSVLAATAARVLARAKGKCEPDEVFLGALLQDIGVLVLAQAFPDVYAEVEEEARRQHSRLQGLEQQRFGCDHVAMGVWLAKTWHLPKMFCEAIAGSHDPNQAESENRKHPMICCVALSGPLAHIWEDPDMVTACQEARKAAKDLLWLDEEALHSALVSTAKGFREASEIFKVSLRGSDQIHQILAKALEELSSTPE